MNNLIIFDLDGVLFETRDMHFQTFNSALARNGFPQISYERHLTEFNGLPTKVKLEKLGITGDDALDVNVQKQHETISWLRRHLKHDERLSKFILTLNKYHNYKIAVCSNAVRQTVHTALDLLWLHPYVHFIIAGNDGHPPKPSPAMYLRCMEQCGSDPAHTFIVEDSPVGIEGARASGATVIEVSGPEEVLGKVWDALGLGGTYEYSDSNVRLW